MNLKTLRFVPLDESHIAAIQEIEKEWNSSPWSERSFQNELTNPQSVFRVAIVDANIVGYGGVWNLVDECHVTTLAIAKDVRRSGLGKRLIINLLSEAKLKGMNCATLEVRASNEGAIKLYESLGFSKAAVRKKYYPDNQEDAIVMWLYNLDGLGTATNSK